MAAPTFIIEYIDGSAEEVKLLPRAQIAYEAETKRSLRGDVESLTELYRLAWYAAGKPDGSLQEWAEKIESLSSADENTEEGDGDRPT